MLNFDGEKLGRYMPFGDFQNVGFELCSWGIKGTVNTHTHTHTHTYTHMRTHAHTYIHSHTLNRNCNSG